MPPPGLAALRQASGAIGAACLQRADRLSLVFGHGYLGQMASTAPVVEEPAIRGERPDWTRCGRNDDIEAGVADGHLPCRGAWVEPDDVCTRLIGGHREGRLRLRAATPSPYNAATRCEPHPATAVPCTLPPRYRLPPRLARLELVGCAGWRTIQPARLPDVRKRAPLP